MRRTRRCSARLGALLAALLALNANCGDDPTSPVADRWADVPLPSLGHTALFGIAAHGMRVVAAGTDLSTAPPRPAAVQTVGQAWSLLTLPAVPASAIFLGVGLDAGGLAVILGGTLADAPLVLDERVAWNAIQFPGTGFLQAVASGRSDSLLAVGTSSGGLAALRSPSGTWVPDHAGFTTPQEKGLVDVAFASSVFVACGWDDATGAAIVRQLDSTGWKAVEGPGGIDIPETRVEHHAVWLDPAGTLWLGGTSIDGAGGEEVYSARLARRTAAGDWFEVVLPDRLGAEVVNDILRAADGSVYLACGRTTARVLRWDGTHWQEEQPTIPGRFLALAETADGAVYAAGVRREGAGEERPLLRRRRPS